MRKLLLTFLLLIAVVVYSQTNEQPGININATIDFIFPLSTYNKGISYPNLDDINNTFTLVSSQLFIAKEDITRLKSDLIAHPDLSKTITQRLNEEQQYLNDLTNSKTLEQKLAVIEAEALKSDNPKYIVSEITAYRNSQFKQLINGVYNFLFSTNVQSERDRILKTIPFRDESEKIIFVAAVLGNVPYNHNMANGKISQSNNMDYGDVYSAVYYNSEDMSHVCSGISANGAILMKQLNVEGIIRTRSYSVLGGGFHTNIYNVSKDKIYMINANSGNIAEKDNNQLSIPVDINSQNQEVAGINVQFHDVYLDGNKIKTRPVGSSPTALGDYLMSLGKQYGFQNPMQELFASNSNVNLNIKNTSFGAFYGNLHNGDNIKGLYVKNEYSKNSEVVLTYFNRSMSDSTYQFKAVQNGIYIQNSNTLPLLNKKMGTDVSIKSSVGENIAGMISLNQASYDTKKITGYNIDGMLSGFGKTTVSYQPNNGSFINEIKGEAGVEFVPGSYLVGVGDIKNWRIVFNRFFAEGTFNFNLSSGQKSLVFNPRYYYLAPLKEDILTAPLCLQIKSKKGEKYEVGIAPSCNLNNGSYLIQASGGVSFNCHKGISAAIGVKAGFGESNQPYAGLTCTIDLAK